MRPCDAWKSDIVCGDGMAGEGVNRWKNGVHLADVGGLCELHGDPSSKPAFA